VGTAISTPTLLSNGRMEPRKIIGTVDTSEFVVASCASADFLLTLSVAEVPWGVVGTLLVGGIIADPIAAWVVRIQPMRVLGTAVGGVILFTNMRTFMGAIGVEGGLAAAIYVLVVVVWLVALTHSLVTNHQERKASTQAEVVPA
jgi:uncharacterized membrane protein YfcA